MSGIHLEPAFGLPGEPRIGGAARVLFHHPAYPDLNPPLLRLYALDKDRDGKYGLDYDTALVACAIIANNAFDTGRLATKSDGVFHNVPRPADNLLRGDKYYFCVGDDDPSQNKYRVVPSFDHWRFPHTLPSPWKDLRISPSMSAGADEDSGAAVRSRDVTCRVSGHANAVKLAHIVPIADGEWFISNKMDKYCGNDAVVHYVMDDRNMVLLRADLHYLFNSRRFTFIAKSAVTPTSDTSPAGSAPAAAVLTLQVLVPDRAKQLAQLYHNRQLQPICDLAPELLFARFAWSLFTDKLYPFFAGSQIYEVALYNRDDMSLEEDSLPGHAVRTKMRIFPAYTISENKSSQKRPREEPTEASSREVEDEDESSDEEDVDPRPPRGARPPTAAEVYKEQMRLLYGDDAVSSDEEDRRGRTMKRRFEDLESPPGLGASSETASEAGVSTPVPSGSPPEMGTPPDDDGLDGFEYKADVHEKAHVQECKRQRADT